MDINKYYFINIQIPLEILPNKDNKLLSDRIDITFSECQSLPPIKTNHATFVSDKIKEFVNVYSSIESNHTKIDNNILSQPQSHSIMEPEPTSAVEEPIPVPEPKKHVAYVTKTAPKYPKNPNANISFKNRKSNTREFTKKNYDSILT